MILGKPVVYVHAGHAAGKPGPLAGEHRRVAGLYQGLVAGDRAGPGRAVCPGHRPAGWFTPGRQRVTHRGRQVSLQATGVPSPSVRLRRLCTLLTSDVD